MGILKLENVCYRYKDAPKDSYVFKNINYDFEEGKMYAIKGKSGSGKTTLLSLITGLENCTEGQILYDGKELKKMNLDTYRNTDIGIVFQSYNLLPRLTALENIILSMDISKIKVEDKKQRALELMKSVGLSEDKANRKILKLSGGEQQRIAIARSLAYNPKIIIADEPTGNLDKDTENEILKIFKRLAKDENKCIVIVTHSQNVCDNVDIVYDLQKKDVVHLRKCLKKCLIYSNFLIDIEPLLLWKPINAQNCKNKSFEGQKHTKGLLKINKFSRHK